MNINTRPIENMPGETLSEVDQFVIQTCNHFLRPHDEVDVPGEDRWLRFDYGHWIISPCEKLSCKDRRWLNEHAKAGVILREDNFDQPPMYFADEEALENAWDEIRGCSSFGQESEA